MGSEKSVRRKRPGRGGRVGRPFAARELKPVNFRVAVDDYDRLAAAAAEYEVTIAMYFRDMVRRELERLDVIASDREVAKAWASEVLPIVGRSVHVATTPANKAVRKLTAAEKRA